MRLLSLFLSLTLGIFLFSACEKESDHDHDTIDPEYHAHIHMPNADNKQLGSSLTIKVDFESHSGVTVHHINIQIFNKADNTVVYSKPDEAHVHETDGAFTFEDTLELTAENGFSADSDWVLQAKVWGHEAGVAEVTETVEFRIVP